jgi:phenylpyruvate tautomerase PptA (4-oxalocrotonate tautomerase family)
MDLTPRGHEEVIHPMPMLDAYIPKQALSESAERELLRRVTDLFLEFEGVDPTIPQARHMTWVFVHRPDVYVAGAPPRTPRYRFICQVPEGQYNDERRAAVNAEITRAVADAEDGAWPHPEHRVCIFTLEVPDGAWGGSGRTLRLPDIYEIIFGPERREEATRVLTARRRQVAEEVFSDAGFAR